MNMIFGNWHWEQYGYAMPSFMKVKLIEIYGEI